MVPTTSLAQDLNFTINDLFRAQTPEDKDLAEVVIQTITTLVDRLKPVLHYIAKPMKNTHVVAVSKLGDSSYMLGISKDGTFGWIKNDGGERTFEASPDGFHCVTVQDVIDGLRAALKDAEDRRNQHTAAVAKRRELLDGIQKLIVESATA